MLHPTLDQKPPTINCKSKDTRLIIIFKYNLLDTFTDLRKEAKSVTSVNLTLAIESYAYLLIRLDYLILEDYPRCNFHLIERGIFLESCKTIPIQSKPLGRASKVLSFNLFRKFYFYLQIPN